MSAVWVPAQGNRLVSELVVGDLTAEQIWCWLASPPLWPFCHGGISDVSAGSALTSGALFRCTIGGQPLYGEVTQYEPPRRLTWRSGDSQFIWRIEYLRRGSRNSAGGGIRLRAEVRRQGRVKIDTAIDADWVQRWLDGLVAAARSGHPAEHRVITGPGTRA
jgi:hypothetical protein